MIRGVDEDEESEGATGEWVSKDLKETTKVRGIAGKRYLHDKRRHTHEICFYSRVAHPLDHEWQECPKCTDWERCEDVENDGEQLFRVCHNILDVSHADHPRLSN